MMVLGIWLAFAVFSYLMYPLLVNFLANGTSLPYKSFNDKKDGPLVSIFIPLHNEGNIIGQKLQSILHSSYPNELIRIYCGLDGCTDNSLAVLKTFQAEFPLQVNFYSADRKGKPEMLNTLYRTFQPADETVLILTDANVLFKEDTIFELVKYFKDDEIGLVDAAFIVNDQHISHQMEGEYLNLEQRLKFSEGKKWGVMQGPFGGCYAVRAGLFPVIPKDFLVDDFFVAMHILKNGYKAILNPKANVIEEVHTDWQDEFARKSRISAGNFQNLAFYIGVLTKPFTPLAFCFFFHKIVRWVLPVIALPVLLLAGVEMSVMHQPFWPLLITLTLILLPIPLHYLLQQLNLPSQTIQRLSYFIYINIALLFGFISFTKGVKSNVWKPTKRN